MQLQPTSSAAAPPPHADRPAWLKSIALGAGADDAAAVSLDAPGLEQERLEILKRAPWAKSLVALAFRMNRGPLRTPSRSVSNNEFHGTYEHGNAVGRALVRSLENVGVQSFNPSTGFPMEMEDFPGRIWVVSHKTVAEAAGLGRIGIHRSVIHPKFGSFVTLGTVVTDLDLSPEDQRLDEAPCFSCKLCVAACPVGAIHPDGAFDFAACANHNYREFMGGFTEWAEDVAEAGSARSLRSRVSDAESASMWQSLSFGANYKAAYCIAACPAGEDVVEPFRTDRRRFLDEVVRPFQDAQETLYVVPGSDAEAYAAKRFPHKPRRQVRGWLRPTSVEGFFESLPLVFQRRQAKGVTSTLRFILSGERRIDRCVRIEDGAVVFPDRTPDHVDVTVRAQGRHWLAFLRGDLSMARALLTRRIRPRGDLGHLRRFGRLFLS